MQQRFINQRSQIDKTIELMGMEEILKGFINSEINKRITIEAYKKFQSSVAEKLENAEELKDYLTEEKFLWIFEKLFMFLSTGFDWATKQAALVPNNFCGVVWLKAEEIMPYFMQQLVSNYEQEDRLFIEKSFGNFDLIAYEVEKDFLHKTE